MRPNPDRASGLILALALVPLVGGEPALAKAPEPRDDGVHQSERARRRELLDRLETWKPVLESKNAPMRETRERWRKLKAAAKGADSKGELQILERELNRFEERSVKRLTPWMEVLPKPAQAALKAAAARTKARRRHLGKDKPPNRSVAAVEKKTIAAGLGPSGLGSLFEGLNTRPDGGQFSPAAIGAGSPATAWIAKAMQEKFGARYPRPSHRVKSMPGPVPEPAYSAAAAGPNGAGGSAQGTPSNAVVTRIALEKKMSPAIVRLAFHEGRKQGVDYRLILAVISAESNFNSNAGSSAGARGLMQLMPATARGLGVRGNLYNPETNVSAGTKYLKQLWSQFARISFAALDSVNPFGRSDVKKAIAAYNAGPGAVQKYGGVPPYRETRAYVNKVLNNYVKYRDYYPAV